MPETLDPIALAAERARRLAMIADGYEVDEYGTPDGSVPGAARPEGVTWKRPDEAQKHFVVHKHPRYVLVTQYDDRGDYRLHLADGIGFVEAIAAGVSREGEQVVCYFDLDQLAGDEPLIFDGDVVRYQHEEYVVSRVDEDLVEGELARSLCLVRKDREARDWDDYDYRVDPDDVEVIEHAYPDERMPVRYGLAKVVVSVVFNTVPSP